MKTPLLLLLFCFILFLFGQKKGKIQILSAAANQITLDAQRLTLFLTTETLAARHFFTFSQHFTAQLYNKTNKQEKVFCFVFLSHRLHQLVNVLTLYLKNYELAIQAHTLIINMLYDDSMLSVNDLPAWLLVPDRPVSVFQKLLIYCHFTHNHR